MTTQKTASNKSFSAGIWRSLLITIGATVVLPYLIYQLASPHLSTLQALLLAGIPPAAVTVLDLLRARRLNLLGTFALLAIVLNLITGLLFKDARLLLISSSLLPGLYGALMLISVLMGKPILLTLIKSTLANVPETEREQLEKRWLANGTSSFKFVTTLWGIGLLSVPVICIVLISMLTIQQYAPIGPIIQYAMFGTLLLISHIYSFIRHVIRAHAEAQQKYA